MIQANRLWSVLATALLVAQGCSSVSHPSLQSSGSEVKTYFYAHCRNGESIRKFDNLVNASRMLTTEDVQANYETPPPDQLRLDKELAICSQDTDDQWLAQATQVTLLEDFQIDSPQCVAQRDHDFATMPNTTEVAQFAYDRFFNCIELSASNRQTIFQNLAKSTTFSDIREASNNAAKAESQAIAGDKDMAKQMHDGQKP